MHSFSSDGELSIPSLDAFCCIVVRVGTRAGGRGEGVQSGLGVFSRVFYSLPRPCRLGLLSVCNQCWVLLCFAAIRGGVRLDTWYV